MEDYMCGLSCWLLVGVLLVAGRWCDVMVVDDGNQESRARLAITDWAGTIDAPALLPAPSCHRNPFTYYRYKIHIRSFRGCVAYILQVHICIFLHPDFVARYFPPRLI